MTSFMSLYNAGAYAKFGVCFHREIDSCPTDQVMIRMEDGKMHQVINTCSYNYLGFASNEFDQDKLYKCIDNYGLGCYINRRVADLQLFKDMEQRVASYVGVEDAIVHTMGYDTNALSIPYLVDKKTLILSDKFNHNSIVKGCTVAGATIQTFTHQDMSTLEARLNEA